MNKILIYHKKTITSGMTIEQTSYERAIVHGNKIPQKWIEKRRIAKLIAEQSLTKAELAERKMRNRKLSMRRSKKILMRLVDSNVYQYQNTKGKPYPPTFLTLTFKKDIKNQKDANNLFTLFIKRLNYYIHKNESYSLRYSVVIEFQDKKRGGVIHYHIIFYDLPFIKATTLEKLWGEGSINITKIKHVEKIGKYISKYMSKNFEDARLDGHKRYFSSRGLIKPRTYAGNAAYELIRNAIPADAFKEESEFTSGKLGKITKTIFSLKRKSVFGDNSLLSDEDIKKIEPYDIS